MKKIPYAVSRHALVFTAIEKVKDHERLIRVAHELPKKDPMAFAGVIAQRALALKDNIVDQTLQLMAKRYSLKMAPFYDTKGQLCPRALIHDPHEGYLHRDFGGNDVKTISLAVHRPHQMFSGNLMDLPDGLIHTEVQLAHAGRSLGFMPLHQAYLENTSQRYRFDLFRTDRSPIYRRS